MIRKSIETCLLLLFIGLFNISLNGQNKETDLIGQLLSKNKNLFSKVLEAPGKYKVQIIDRIKEGMRPKSVWVGNQYDASSHGTKLLKSMFGEFRAFSFPKSVHATREVINIISNE